MSNKIGNADFKLWYFSKTSLQAARNPLAGSGLLSILIV
jgi:hypothetical protein